jgi:hypothetical protein
MIPVIQTKVVVKNSNGDTVVRGNCFAAVIASFMEVPITEVPNVEVLFDNDKISWYGVMQAWLNNKGYEIATNSSFSVFHKNDYNEIGASNAFSYAKDRMYIVTAMSPRGVYHCCIYKNGKLIHDPHPSNDGIDEETISYFEEIVKLEP